VRGVHANHHSSMYRSVVVTYSSGVRRHERAREAARASNVNRPTRAPRRRGAAATARHSTPRCAP
jgi:hypothetical protein